VHLVRSDKQTEAVAYAALLLNALLANESCGSCTAYIVGLMYSNRVLCNRRPNIDL